MPHKASVIPAAAAAESTKTDGPAIPAINVESNDEQTMLRDEAVEPAGFYDTLDGVPAPRRTQELVEQLHRSAVLDPEESAMRQ